MKFNITKNKKMFKITMGVKAYGTLYCTFKTEIKRIGNKSPYLKWDRQCFRFRIPPPVLFLTECEFVNKVPVPMTSTGTLPRKKCKKERTISDEQSISQ
jgi:hypothetical protein